MNIYFRVNIYKILSIMIVIFVFYNSDYMVDLEVKSLIIG